MTGILLRKTIAINAKPAIALNLTRKALSEAVIQVADRVPKQWVITEDTEDKLMAQLTLRGLESKDSLLFLLDASCKLDSGDSQLEILYTSENSNPEMLRDVSNKTHTMLVATLS